jgi:hypothetical protein
MLRTVSCQILVKLAASRVDLSFMSEQLVTHALSALGSKKRLLHSVS